MKWIEEHRAICNKNEDTCEHCYIIGESLWAMSQAQEERKEHKTEEQKQKETKLVYNYKLREWREE